MEAIEEVEMLASLVSKRIPAIQNGDAWENYTDAEKEHALDKLIAIQNDILKLDFRDPQPKLLALSMLVDGSDQPNFADDFKNALFETLRGVRGQ